MAAGAAVGGIFGLIGSGMSSALSAKEARKNRKWQKMMSDTAYQRTMKDMRLAGLNPILAAKIGGATTPPGAMARYDIDTKGAVGTALAVRRQHAELELLREQAAESRERQADSWAHRDYVGKEGELVDTQAANARLQWELNRYKKPGAKWEATLDKTWYGKGTRAIQRLNPLKGILKP